MVRFPSESGMMRNPRLMLALGLLLAAALGSTQEPQVRTVDWTPPASSLPKEYVNQIKLLLGNGLSDPRGTGELSWFEVFIGEGLGRQRERQRVLGWPIPGTTKAVLADGLTYPVLQRLGPGTTQELVAATTAKRQSFGDQLMDKDAVAALMVLRGELSVVSEMAISAKERGYKLAVWLQLRLRMELAQALGDRRDRDAVDLAKQLVTLEAAIERSPFSLQDRAALRKTDSGLLLLKDCRRRLRYPSALPDFQGLKQLSQPARIKQLVTALDEVGAVQTDEPGIPYFEEDPIYKALVDEGDKAVPALIDAMAKDHRFSRSISFWRSWSFARTFVTVSSVAAAAIQDIWPPSKELMRRKDFSTELLRKTWADPIAKQKLRSEYDAREREINETLRSLAALHAGSSSTVVVLGNQTKPEAKLRTAHLDQLRSLVGNGLSDPRGTGDLSLFKVLIADGSNRVPMDCYGWPIRGTERAVLTDGLTYKVEHRIRAATNKEVAERLDADQSLSSFAKTSKVTWIPLLLAREDNAAANARLLAQGIALDLVPRGLYDRLGLELAQALRDGRYEDSLERAQQMAALEKVAKLGETGTAMHHDLMHPGKASSEDMDWREFRDASPDHKRWLLYRALDQIRGGPVGMKGWGSLEEDPIFQGLLALGPEAIPRLITAYEEETEFTHMSSYSLRTWPHITFYTVKDVAKATILSIWPGSKPLFADPATAPAKLREAWEKGALRGRPSTFDPTDNSLISMSRDDRMLYPSLPHQFRTVEWTPPASSLPPAYIEDIKLLLGNGLSDPRGTGPLSLFRSRTKHETLLRFGNHEFYGWPITGTQKAIAIDGLTYDYIETVRAAKVEELFEYRISLGMGNERRSITHPDWPLLPGLLLLRENHWAVKELTTRYNHQNLNLYGSLARSYRIAAGQAVRDGQDERACELAKVEEGIQALWQVNHHRLAAYYAGPDLAESIRWTSTLTRRLDRPKKPVDLKSISKLPRKERIEALISSLDQVRGEPVARTFGDGPGPDPIFLALIKEGQDIVEPLLAVWHSDTRLTRARRWAPLDHPLFSVSEVALQAIRTVWPAGVPNAPYRPQTIEDYLTRFRLHQGLSPAEQEVANLADSALSHADFEAGLERIKSKDRAGAKSLVEQMNPGLKAKVVRRVNERINTALLYDLSNNSQVVAEELAPAMRLGRKLYGLNPREGIAALKKLTATSAKFARPVREGYSSQLTELAATVIFLFQNGEPEAINDYIAVLAIVEPSERHMPLDLSPLAYDFGDNPVWDDAIRQYFARWKYEAENLDVSKPMTFYDRVSRQDVKLFLSPHYRDFLIYALSLEKPFGAPTHNQTRGILTLSVAEERRGVNLDFGKITPEEFAKIDPQVLVGDLVASELQRHTGGPEFSMRWSREHRANARQAIRKWLRRQPNSPDVK